MGGVRNLILIQECVFFIACNGKGVDDEDSGMFSWFSIAFDGSGVEDDVSGRFGSISSSGSRLVMALRVAITFACISIFFNV